jgi:hypothetical protein
MVPSPKFSQKYRKTDDGQIRREKYDKTLTKDECKKCEVLECQF